MISYVYIKRYSRLFLLILLLYMCHFANAQTTRNGIVRHHFGCNYASCSQ